MESSLSRGYSFVFLIKDHSNVKDLTFENIKLDMERIFKETELIVMEKNEKDFYKNDKLVSKKHITMARK